MTQRWLVRDGADLGAAIAEIRVARELTQAELSEQLGISRSWLARLELGRSTQMVDLLVRVLRSMGATITIEFDVSGAGDEVGASGADG